MSFLGDHYFRMYCFIVSMAMCYACHVTHLRHNSAVCVTGPTRREASRSMCKFLLIDMVKNTGRVEQMANRYIEGKANEYLSKWAWSSIGEQYTEGLTRGVIQVQSNGPGMSRHSPNGRQRVNPMFKAEDQEPDKQATQKTRLKLK